MKGYRSPSAIYGVNIQLSDHIFAYGHCKNKRSGAAGMFETTMVAILVSAICALIAEYGGFEALLDLIKRIFKGKKGGELGMGLLVGAMDIATANNTVAIVMANPYLMMLLIWEARPLILGWMLLPWIDIREKR